MLRNAALACAQAGLDVEVLVLEVGRRYQGIYDLYADLPVRVTRIRPRGLWSPGWGYPRPVAWLSLLPNFTRILDGLRPRTVVTHIDVSDAWRAIHWWAQRRGVPGVVLQEGIATQAKSDPSNLAGIKERFLSPAAKIQTRLLRLILPSLFRRAERNTYSQHVCAWGEAMRRQLVAQGVCGGRVEVTGCPRFDSVRGRGALPDATLSTVLFAHQHALDEDAEHEFVRAVVDVCVNRLGCNLILRPHPWSSLQKSGAHRVVRDVTTKTERVTVADTGDVTDYLDSASVFLTMHSSSAYDAVVHGIPLVIANWIDRCYRFNAADYGAALQVDSPSGLEEALRTALWDKATRQRLHAGGDELIEDHLFALDGGSAARFADFVRRLLVSAS